MRKAFSRRVSPCALIFFLYTLSASAAQEHHGAIDLDAEALYQARCASCHDNPTNNTPPRNALAYRSPASVVRVLSDGLMRNMAVGLSAAQIHSLAVLLTGREPGPAIDVTTNACKQPGGPVVLGNSDWASIGGDLHNLRHRADAGLNAETVPRLRQKWAFGIPGGAPGTVALAGGRLFLAAGTGHVMSLDATGGCLLWAHDTEGKLVRRVTVAAIGDESSRSAVFFGDANGGMTALDSETGTLLWHTRVEQNALARITISPSVHKGRVYVPVSSIEDPLTHDESHACCTFRGSVVALDAATGRQLWKQYTIPQPNRQLAPASGDEPARFGPAGGAVYLPLAIDAQRNVVYASTAESYDYNDPAGTYSVIAYDLDTGQLRWQKQFLPEAQEREAICEEVGYTDCRNLFSVGTAVTIHSLSDGRQILLVAQKTGDVYALDPDERGRILWQNKAAFGGDLGGIMYGMSAVGDVVYVPVSDAYVQPPRKSGGLVAINASNGETLWQVAAPSPACNWSDEDCEAAVVSAATTVPGVVLLGHTDGHLRGYAMTDGALIWSIDTAVNYQSINGVETRGGQVNGFPVVIGEGAIYVVSGAASQARPGNALLMYTVDGK